MSCAIPLGIGAGSIDTALNNYVALHYNAMQMSFLHCFYGIGVSLSPYLMSLALSENMNWRKGYRTVFFIQMTIAVITIITLPLWKKVQTAQTDEEKIFKLADYRCQSGNDFVSYPIPALSIRLYNCSSGIVFDWTR